MAGKLSLMDDREYAATVARHAELQAEAGTLRKSIADLGTRMGTAATGDDTDEAALGLVSGGGNGLESAAVIRGQLDEMRHRLTVVDRAVVLQRKIMETERSRASRVVCDARHGEYTTLISNLAKAVRSLKAAIVAERNFREELIAGDVSFTAYLYPMGLPSRFDGSDGDSCDAWLTEAAAHYAI